MVPNVRVIDEEARRSVLVDPSTGEPANAMLMVAPSETTPGRIRLAFGVRITHGDDEGIVLVSPPFRIESN